MANANLNGRSPKSGFVAVLGVKKRALPAELTFLLQRFIMVTVCPAGKRNGQQTIWKVKACV